MDAPSDAPRLPTVQPSAEFRSWPTFCSRYFIFHIAPPPGRSSNHPPESADGHSPPPVQEMGRGVGGPKQGPSLCLGSRVRCQVVDRRGPSWVIPNIRLLVLIPLMIQRTQGLTVGHGSKKTTKLEPTSKSGHPVIRFLVSIANNPVSPLITQIGGTFVE